MQCDRYNPSKESIVERIKFKLIDSYLDVENPKQRPIEDQVTMIDFLIKEEKVKNLAKDISDNGLSPMGLMGIIKHKDNTYTVVEGNRRIACNTSIQ